MKESMLTLFKKSVDVDNPKLTTNLEESSTIEFKLSLHTHGETINKDYLSSISGFANNQGGTLIFGIEPITHELVGIKDKYENLDNMYVSTTVRNGLDGNIEYVFYTHRYIGVLIGFLSVKKAASRPVVVKVDSGPVKRGEIYFRYPAQTTKIEAADLRMVLEEEVQSRVNKLIESMQKIQEMGVQNVALINTQNGEIDLGNQDGRKLVLNEETLKNLNLIKQGKLVDVDGAPAYMIKGEIEVEGQGKPILSKEADIYESFFSQACEHPHVMLEQLALSSSQYNPLFFLIYKADMSKAEATKLITDVEGADVVIKTKNEVLKRIKNDDATTLYHEGVLIDSIKTVIEPGKTLDETIQLVFEEHAELNSSTKTKVIRTLAYNTLMAKITLPDEVYEEHLKRIIEASSNFSAEFITTEKEYVLEQIKKIYTLISVMKPAESTLIRKSIYNIDRVLYLGLVKP